MADADPLLPRRTFVTGGEEWVAQVTGQTRSGTGSDAGAPLLYLAFALTRTPTAWAREGIAVARSIDDLTDEDLESLFARARPLRPREKAPSPGPSNSNGSLPSP
jgi:hypothetical protein